MATRLYVDATVDDLTNIEGDYFVDNRHADICVEVPIAMLKTVLTPEDTTMAEGLTRTVGEYLDIVAATDTTALVRLKIRDKHDTFAKTGLIGLKKQDVKTLLRKLKAVPVKERDVIDKYRPEPEPKKVTRKKLEAMTYREVQDAAKQADVKIPLNSKKVELIEAILRS